MSKIATMRRVEKDMKEKRSGKKKDLEGPWEGAAQRLSIRNAPWNSLKFSTRSSIERRMRGAWQKRSGDWRREDKSRKLSKEASQRIKARETAAEKRKPFVRNI